jgi:hypothetical protein
MNERADPERELDRRIDQALRRRFEPPASLERLAERALARPARARRPAPWLVLVAAAAAALVAWLAPWRAAPDAAPRRAWPGSEELAGLAPPPGSPRAPACRPVGPLEPPTGRPQQVHSPDLARLYSAMDACQRSAAALPCPENADLAERLFATYGKDIELRPDALGFLQGPFASADWPTAMILTGFVGDQTSVLVAERDATLECCLCVDLPEDSGLRRFTWQVGDVVLTEITPHAEPRMLEYLE